MLDKWALNKNKFMKIIYTLKIVTYQHVHVFMLMQV